MSSTRTQVYLTEEQRKHVDEIAAAEGVTMAEVIRRALDTYLAREGDASAALAATFGGDPNLIEPNRAEWDRG